MRGWCNSQSTMLTFVDLDGAAPPDHLLRVIRRVADKVLDGCT